MRHVFVVTMILALLASMPQKAGAHHAMEYIELESYQTAKKGEHIFHLHYDYMVDDSGNPHLDHWELTPGISVGITDRLMFDIHTHFAKFGYDHLAEEDPAYEPLGPSPFMEAVAGCLQFRLTEGWPLDFALAAGFELPFDRAKKLLGSEDYVYSGALLFGRGFQEHGNVTFNLCYEAEGDEDAFMWGAGIKTPLTADSHGISAGVEIMGLFEDAGDNWSILPGVYFPLGTRNLILKTGIETGKSGGADIMRANLTLMCLF
jgi:hypothetical protein